MSKGTCTGDTHVRGQGHVLGQERPTAVRRVSTPGQRLSVYHSLAQHMKCMEEVGHSTYLRPTRGKHPVYGPPVDVSTEGTT